MTFIRLSGRLSFGMKIIFLLSIWLKRFEWKCHSKWNKKKIQDDLQLHLGVLLKKLSILLVRSHIKKLNGNQAKRILRKAIAYDYKNHSFFKNRNRPSNWRSNFSFRWNCILIERRMQFEHYRCIQNRNKWQISNETWLTRRYWDLYPRNWRTKSPFSNS